MTIANCYMVVIGTRTSSWSIVGGCNATRSAVCSVKIWQALASGENHSVVPGTIIKADKESIQIACGEGVLDIVLLQLPGGKVLDATAILNGRASWFTAGTVFGSNS